MKKVKITVMKTACYKDLIEKYENPVTHACDMVEAKCLLLMAGRSQKAFAIALGTVYPHL